MNTLDILKYGDATFRQALSAIPREAWEQAGVCGQWNTRELVAHLASYEVLLCEILVSLSDNKAATPTLDNYRQDFYGFNDTQVVQRQAMSSDGVLAEYETAHAQVMQMAAQLPADMCIAAGTLPWYGTEYSLDDFIVYTYYGHKRQHSAQLDGFASSLQNMVAALRLHEATSQRDLEAMVAAVAPEIIFENTAPAPDGERLVGQAALRQWWQGWLASTPQIQFTVEQALPVSYDSIVTRWRYDWQSQDDSIGHIRGMTLYRVADGKITEDYSYVKG